MGSDEARSNGKQRDEILKSSSGERGPWLAVNDSVAAVVKYVVGEVFTAQKFLSGPGARSLGNKRDEFLKSGPGLPTLLPKEQK